MSSEQYNFDAKINSSIKVENDKTIPIEALIQLFQADRRPLASYNFRFALVETFNDWMKDLDRSGKSR